MQGIKIAGGQTYRGQFRNHDGQYGKSVDNKVRQVVMCVMCAHKESINEVKISAYVQQPQTHCSRLRRDVQYYRHS